MMKKKNYMLAATLLVLLLTAVLLYGCGSQKTEQSGSGADAPAVAKLNAEEAREMLEGDELLYLVDVRTAEEYEESHIPNAILIPNETIGDTQPPELPELDAPILIYCRSGNRSAQAANKLIDLGYTNVYDFGGIKDWPYETEAGAYDATAADPLNAPDPLAPADAPAAANPEDPKPVLTGEFKEFTATALDGSTITQDILSGHDLTVINIWGTFCGPCIREMPELGKLASEYADKKLQIIGVVVDATAEDEASVKNAQAIVKKTKADYLHLLPSQDLTDIKLGEINVIPTTLFIDSQGRIVDSVVGAKDKDTWKKIFDKQLEAVK